MKESWHDSVLQIIHILCYYDTRLHFPIRNYDKQHQANNTNNTPGKIQILWHKQFDKKTNVFLQITK